MVSVLDTAGQEEYRPAFLNRWINQANPQDDAERITQGGIGGFVLVYAIDEMKTWDCLLEIYEKICQVTEDLPEERFVTVCCNKYDIFEESPGDIPQRDGKYIHEMAAEFCQQESEKGNRISHVCTSAKTKKNIDFLFQTAVGVVREGRLKVTPPEKPVANPSSGCSCTILSVRCNLEC